jgi:hypothetical protein
MSKNISTPSNMSRFMEYIESTDYTIRVFFHPFVMTETEKKRTTENKRSLYSYL